MKERILIELDKVGAEWVAVAYICGDARMIQVVEENKDPHLITGMLISGLPAELVLKEHKLLGMLTDANEIEEVRRRELPEIFQLASFLPRTMSVRQCGKKSNHGLNYIMGPNEFANFSELDITDSRRIGELYVGGYTGLPLWWKRIEDQLRQNRTVSNCFGRLRRFLGPWGHDIVKGAVAFVPQSTVSDIVTYGMVQCFGDDDLMSRADLLANVHDSLLFQLEVKDWKQAAADCHLIGMRYLNRECHYGGRSFRIGTDMKVGRSWGHMKGVALSNDIDKLAADLRKAWGDAVNVQEGRSDREEAAA